MSRTRDSLLLIGGELVASESCLWIESTNPATEEYLGRVERANHADVDRGYTAASWAQPKWAPLSVADRAKYLDRRGKGHQHLALTKGPS